MEAGFFGMSLGFSSYVSVIPLFVATLTESGVLIGLISAMRIVGWLLPQLLTANRVAGLRRYKPLVMLMTLNERLPFFALAMIALAIPTLGREGALLLTFIFVIWQSLGAGLTAPAWISMTAKIIPVSRRGQFYGTLGATSNLLSSGGAVLSGAILAAGEAPTSFALCFFLAGLSQIISFSFLSQVREEASLAEDQQKSRTMREFWRGLGKILRQDRNFRIFILARVVAQFSAMGTAFYTIYAVRNFGMDAGTAGILTGVLLLAQVVGSPLVGWLGDRYSHRIMYAVGAFMAGAAALIAVIAPGLEWFYLVFILSGLANAGFMTPMFALSAEFGSDTERPYYIGLGNTLVAPAALLAPLIGGFLADSFSYASTFSAAALAAVLTVLIMVLAVREPRHHVTEIVPVPTSVEVA
jgi:MFS family permease